MPVLKMGNTASTRYGSAPAKVLVLSHDLYETRKDGSPTPKPRDGNHVDVKRLNELFQSRGIKSLFHENFTKHEILTTLNYFCEVEVNPHCMAVVVMTHGGNRGTLEAKDEAYRTWDVYEALQKCKTKLRIIFFIACRGNTLEKLVYTNDKPKASTSSRRNNGHSSQPDSGPFDTEEKIQNVGTLIVQDPNFLVVYCTEEIAEKNIGKNKKCLFVIIVAQLKREWYDPAWYIMTDDVSRKSETHETGMQSDGSFNHVPEHFNFLRVYGFGIDFLQHLCVALEIWPHYQRSERIRRDLCRVVRRAMRYYKPIPGQYSYTETTLGVNVMLNGQSWCSATATSTSTTSSSQLSGPVPAPKATRKRN
ncbi:hypothetical protein B566_EDAN004983, partial [Ephemera danica]